MVEPYNSLIVHPSGVRFLPRILINRLRVALFLCSVCDLDLATKLHWLPVCHRVIFKTRLRKWSSASLLGRFVFAICQRQSRSTMSGSQLFKCLV